MKHSIHFIWFLNFNIIFNFWQDNAHLTRIVEMPRGEENPIYLLEMSMALAIWDILAFRQEIAHNSLGGDPFQILANVKFFIIINIW